MTGKKRHALRWWVVAIALSMVLAVAGMSEVWAMGRMCMFSAVQGVVTEHGRPVAGAVVERQFKWAWKGETGIDRAQTDGEGRFHFGAIWRGSLLGGLLPHEPSVEQEIRIVQGDRSFVAWQFVRDSYQENGELFGQPIRLRCDLSKPARKHVLEHDYVRHSIWGLCDLEGVTEIEDESK